MSSLFSPFSSSSLIITSYLLSLFLFVSSVLIIASQNIFMMGVKRSLLGSTSISATSVASINCLWHSLWDLGFWYYEWFSIETWIFWVLFSEIGSYLNFLFYLASSDNAITVDGDMCPWCSQVRVEVQIFHLVSIGI